MDGKSTTRALRARNGPTTAWADSPPMDTVLPVVAVAIGIGASLILCALVGAVRGHGGKQR